MRKMYLIKTGITCILLFASTSWICNERASAEPNQKCIDLVDSYNTNARGKLKEMRADVAKLQKRFINIAAMRAKDIKMTSTRKQHVKILIAQGVKKKTAEMFVRMSLKAQSLTTREAQAKMLLEDIVHKASESSKNKDSIIDECHLE